MNAVKEVPILAAPFRTERLFQQREGICFQQPRIGDHEGLTATHLL